MHTQNKKKSSLALRFVCMLWVFDCMTTTATKTTFKTKPSIITTSQAISKQRNYGNYSIGRVSRCYFAHAASIARSVFPKLFISSHCLLLFICMLLLHFQRIYSMQNLNTWNYYCFLLNEKKNEKRKKSNCVIKVEHSILCWTINLQMNNKLNFFCWTIFFPTWMHHFAR